MLESGQVHKGQWEAMLDTAPNPDDATVERMVRAVWRTTRGTSAFAEEDWKNGGEAHSERIVRAVLAAAQEMGDG